MVARREWRMDSHYFWMILGKIRPIHGLAMELSLQALIAAKYTLFLTPFTRNLQIVPRMAKFGPSLAAIRVWMGVPRNGGWGPRDHWGILAKMRTVRRLSEKNLSPNAYRG